ncbi:hypothetical protein [Flavobacterium denitrificans]|uniref:hypothetical protein n=1 Tax=Flavobacterium denitrificans TaxID=281361 RepID=UPI00041DFDB8|nr:hypothetical protein [Flavobacterium denitrificans]
MPVLVNGAGGISLETVKMFAYYGASVSLVDVQKFTKELNKNTFPNKTIVFEYKKINCQPDLIFVQQNPIPVKELGMALLKK